MDVLTNSVAGDNFAKYKCIEHIVHVKLTQCMSTVSQ